MSDTHASPLTLNESDILAKRAISLKRGGVCRKILIFKGGNPIFAKKNKKTPHF